MTASTAIALRTFIANRALAAEPGAFDPFDGNKDALDFAFALLGLGAHSGPQYTDTDNTQEKNAIAQFCTFFGSTKIQNTFCLSEVALQSMSCLHRKLHLMWMKPITEGSMLILFMWELL